MATKYVSRLRLISEKIIKPSFETPPPFKSYKLSCSDQVIDHNYSPLALFFAKKHNNTSQLLEDSLSKLLASYYPFTGRLIDNDAIVDFGVAGAAFFEVQVKGSMTEILKDSDIGAQNIVFPSGIPWRYSYRGSLLFAQVSHFDCGGMALSVCMSHKVGDGVTSCNFLSDWAAATRRSGQKPSVEFPGASIFPPLDDPPTLHINDPEEYESNMEQGMITKRFVFDGSKIAKLKAMVAAESEVENTTRVEVVTALLYKCSANASNMNAEPPRPSFLLQFANLRPLIMPPLPQNSAGNFVSFFSLSACDERDVNLTKSVAELRKRKEELRHQYKLAVSARDEYMKSVEALLGLIKSNAHLYRCSSLCGQPLYHIDFGWGRPIRVGLAARREKLNFFHLVDDHTGNGIEALVTLTEKDMSVFETDKYLLAFTSLNP